MRKIEQLEKIISLYDNWKPSDIAFIKALKWSTNNLLIIFYSQIRDSTNGWPDISKDFFEISITFKNVSNFKLLFIGMGLQQISGFDIMGVSDRGLENINFQIEDYENDAISFCCEEIEINDVSMPSQLLVK